MESIPDIGDEMNASNERAPEDDSLAFLAGGGEMGHLIRAKDWSKTPIGPPETWPQGLKTALSIALSSRYPIWLGWGWELTNFYNDPYMPILGKRHEWALGASAREVWKEVWEEHLGPQTDAVLLRGEATWNDQLQMVLDRNGYSEETYFTFSISPIPADGGGVGGLLCTCTEDTAKVLGERRLTALRHIAAAGVDAKTEADASRMVAEALFEHAGDVSFSLIYLLNPNGTEVRLAAAAGLRPGHSHAPEAVALGGPPAVWPFDAALTAGKQVVRGLDPGGLPGGNWPEPTSTAAVLPLAKGGRERPRGFMVVGASPRLPFDANYEGFFDLLASGVASVLANAQAYEEEKKRAEALAELDRAKTAFFSNVSHEFRTPLTLILGPVADLLAKGYPEVAPTAKGQLEVVHRNSLRLLKLVNTMLDFSRIEAGRVRASYEPTDLAAYTAELASVFRAAIERAGLRLVVDCPPLSEPVYVDRDMWEKIVLNLLSNAFKFTLEGRIEVCLEAAGAQVRLTVRDTGVGIPAEEVPRIFERFHRVSGSRGRTHEGTGIGLALVQELVKLHGGTVAAQSVLNEGTQFTVTIPLGKDHLDPARIGTPTGLAPTTTGADAFVQEALRWLPNAGERDQESGVSEVTPQDVSSRTSAPCPPTPDSRPRLLWADDNADMREYVTRLLADRFVVEAVPDGQAALEATRANPPDLVLSDVMMPRLDGFGLLRALRSEKRTRDIPIILLSARAGEEARVEGMNAGADDYLVKPFSARELLACVDAHLKMARLRAEGAAALRESEAKLAVELAGAKQLQKISSLLITDENDEGLYEHILDAALAIMGADCGSIQLLDDQRRELRLLAWRNLHPESAAYWQIVSVESGTSCGSALSHGQRIIVPDVRSADFLQDPQTRHQYLQSGILAVQSTPLTTRDGRVIGMISTHWRQPHVPGEGHLALLDILARQMADALERRRVLEALRESEERQAFLLRLSDTLRSLADPEEVKAAASRVLGEHLRVNRAFYADVEADDWIVAKGYEQGVAALRGGRYAADRYGRWIMDTYRAGRAIVFRDTRTDPRFAPAEREAHAAIDIIAAVGVPLVKAGALVAILAVHTAGPREWTDEETRLIEETAERTWAAVERAKAEEALADELSAMTRLHDLADRLLSITDLPTAMGEVLDAAIGLHGADRGTIQIYDPEADVLRYAACRGFDIDMLRDIPPIDRDFHSTCAVALKTGRRVVADNLPSDPRWVNHAPTAALLGYGAAISSPMKTRREELLGILTVHFREPHAPTDRELRWADLYARLAAHLIERGHAEADLRESQERLRQALAATQRANDELEARVAERTAELAEANDRLRAEMGARDKLRGRLASAQEDERRRVARELHHSVGQLLAGLALAFKAIEAADHLAPATAAKLAEAKRVADTLGKEVHGLALRLRPTALDDLGLEAALGQLAGEWSAQTGVPVDLQTTGLSAGRLPTEAETVLYRVVQEALTNVSKHARPRTVSVVVSRLDGIATAVVEDDGAGFDLETAGRGRLGLLGMRERVALAGGEIDVETSPGKGTTVIARIPVDHAGKEVARG